MLRLLTISLIFVNFLFANVNFHGFLAKSYEKNENIKVNNIKITKILKINSEFSAYFVNLELKILGLNKMISKNELFFVNGDLIVSDMIDLKSQKSVRNELLGENVGVSLKNFKKDFSDENDKNCN
ncbi:hypothetical protein [Campylobacter gastrosuis]|uniref:Organic solvent tolerance-like N-terminal domain-containing protein n=1 Tax=Campylobacter gastrosuis TaxID=2974576 RepID=A0ABT7HPH3_9BACT|nr:hypothetical protein [Campylobacter gastrosuis]MDL0088328.1 hypothetical protein [Campylobacter gastrosuis]